MGSGHRPRAGRKKGGRMTLPGGTDQTTDTDRSLLEAAATADLPRVQPRHGEGKAEHPPGRTEPPGDAGGTAPGAGQPARRTPGKKDAR
jgi:hypothetical protein